MSDANTIIIILQAIQQDKSIIHLNSQSMDAFVQEVDRDENIILYIKYMTESIFLGWDSF